MTKSFWWAAILSALLAGAACAADVPDDIADDSDPAAGTILPVADFDLAGQQGNVVLLDFWASWCKPCKESMPWLSRLQLDHGEQGLQVVAVNLDRDLKSARKMLDELDAGILVVHDPQGELADRYELEGMPSSFVYDRDGTLVAKHVGFLAADCGKRESELRALLAAGSKGESDVEE